MKKLFLLGLLVCSPFLYTMGQQQTGKSDAAIDRKNLALRPNSRDYNIVRKGNNHQRIIQIRTQALLRHKQAVLNRKMAMERHRKLMQQQMFRQQNIHQRMIRQRGSHR